MARPKKQVQRVIWAMENYSEDFFPPPLLNILATKDLSVKVVTTFIHIEKQELHHTKFLVRRRHGKRCDLTDYPLIQIWQRSTKKS